MIFWFLCRQWIHRCSFMKHQNTAWLVMFHIFFCCIKHDVVTCKCPLISTLPSSTYNRGSENKKLRTICLLSQYKNYYYINSKISPRSRKFASDISEVLKCYKFILLSKIIPKISHTALPLNTPKLIGHPMPFTWQPVTYLKSSVTSRRPLL